VAIIPRKKQSLVISGGKSHLQKKLRKTGGRRTSSRGWVEVEQIGDIKGGRGGTKVQQNPVCSKWKTASKPMNDQGNYSRKKF